MTLRVVFLGSPAFAVPTLLALHAGFAVAGVVTQPEKPGGRGRRSIPTEVKTTAVALGLPVIEPARLSVPETLSALKQWQPDVMVVVAYGKILPESILGLPPLGCVNLHASLLPRHRGASPIPSAIMAGDQVTGVTTILMDRGMDTGDILLQAEIALSQQDTAKSLHEKLAEPGAQLVVQTLERMEAKTIRPVPQDHAHATYTRLLSKEDGLLEWTRDAEYLHRMVRAMNPWPTAFFHLAGEAVKVWDAYPETGAAVPGSIAAIGLEGVAVGTRQGLLVLKEVQGPGRKRIPAAEFARGRRLALRDKLG